MKLTQTQLRQIIREVIQESNPFGREDYNPMRDDMRDEWSMMRKDFLDEIEEFAVESDKFKKLLDAETKRLNDEKRDRHSPFFESRDIVKYHAELNKMQKLMDRFIKVADAAWDTDL